MPSLNDPVLSICIPAYNAEKWILETLNSALPLNRCDIEIIISNNHSRDCTLDVLNDFKEKHPAIVNVIQPKNHLSMAENWNFVLEHARGKYVALLSADDLISSKMCERAIEVLELNPDLDAVTFEHNKLIHKKNNVITKPRHIASLLNENTELTPDLILKLNPYSINFSFFRVNSQKLKSIKNDVSFFTRNLMTTDYDLWIRLSLIRAKIKYICDIKGLYRIHENNLSNGKSRMLLQTFLVLARHREALHEKCFFPYKIVMVRIFIRCLICYLKGSKETSRLLKILPQYIFLAYKKSSFKKIK